MKPAQVIRHFGGVTAAAKALGIKQPSVSRWLRTGKVPKLRQLHIEYVTAGAMKAERT